MLESVIGAVSLLLIVEGILPLVAPSAWRDMFRRLIEFSDGQLRFVGLASVAAGVALLVLV